MALGVRLRRRREELGLTQVAVAGEIGVSQPFLAQLEAGQKGASDDVLRRLLDHLGMVEELAALPRSLAGDDLVARMGGCLCTGLEVSLAELARTFRVSVGAVRQALRELERGLLPFGIQVLDDGARARLVTAYELLDACAPVVRPRRHPPITKVQIEVLSIVVAHGQVTRKLMEEARGDVDSTDVLETLHVRGYLARDVDEEARGRPLYYRATSRVLDLFRVSTLEELRAFLFAPYGASTLEEVAVKLAAAAAGAVTAAEAQAMAGKLLERAAVE